MDTSTRAFSAVWMSYVAGAAKPVERALDGNLVEPNLRATLLREALSNLEPPARAALFPGGSLPAALVESLGPDTAAEPLGGAEVAAVLVERLARVPWDAVLEATWPLASTLPAEARDDALRTLALASATFPSPFLKPEAHGYTLRGADAEQARRTLAKEPTPAAIAQFDACMALVPEPARWPLLAEAAPLLPAPRRAAALREALASAFLEPDELHVGQAVAAVVLRAPEDLLDPALARSQEAFAEMDDPRASLLRALAEGLQGAELGRVIAEVPKISDEWTRADVLAGLRSRLPDALVERWNEAAATVEDEAARTMLESTEARVEPPPGTAASLLEALHGWAAVARALGGTPQGRAVVAAIVHQVGETARLYELARQAAG